MTLPDPLLIREVRDRLERRFPEVDPDVVDAAVRVTISGFAATHHRPVSARTLELGARERLSFADRTASAGDAGHDGSPFDTSVRLGSDAV